MKLKKLKLSRETLRNLRPEEMQIPAGVDPATYIRCSGTCTKQLCSAESWCYACPPDDTGPVFTGPFYAGCPSYGNYCTVGC